MEKYIIGIDMGNNNVGWSILEQEQGKIEKTGVRLFSISNDAKDRRVTRNTRRRVKRRHNRIKDISNIFLSIGFPTKNTIDNKLIEKRYNGIHEKINKQDIVNIVYYMAVHRGYIPFGDEEVNFIELNGKLPCEYYYMLYRKTGKYRALDNQVKNIENIREIETLLKKQSEFYSEINNNVIENIKNIFIRKRKFWQGPGSINSLTPYGRFKTNEDVKQYIENKNNNPGYEKYIFDNLIGKCKIALGENCASALNYYAELFNLLNDFINTKVKDISKVNEKDYFIKEQDNYKFSTVALQKIINYCTNNTTVSVKSMLNKLFGLNIDNTYGYRVNKQGKPEFSTLNNYRSVLKIFVDNNLNTCWIKDKEIYNKIINEFMVAPGKVELINMIDKNSDINYKFNNQEKEVIKIIYTKLKKSTSFKYHALSEKILKKAIEDMIKTQLNFMQVRTMFDYDKEAREYFSKHYRKSDLGMPILNSKYIDDIIASPQVKKSLRQSIRIINAIIKEKKELPYLIAIESTKELNGNEKQKEIIKEQRINEILKKNAINIINSNYGEEFLNDANIEKVMLYNEINGICPYCNKRKINLDDVVNNRIEIEHILPKSKSFNNSYNNKTLSCQECNHSKGNKTPYYYLKPLKLYDEFKKRVLDNKNYSQKKKDNLLFEENIDKYTIRFFSRNLRDTAYATTELIKQIQLFNYYLKENYNDVQIKTLSTPGMITHEARKRLNIDKDRDDGKHHHAVDASIVAALANTKLGELITKSQNDKKFWLNGKIMLEKDPDLLYKFNLKDYKEQLININEDNINLSYAIDKDANKQLANANIYKYIKKGENYYKIDQINNIYSIDFSDKASIKQFEKLLDVNDMNQTLLCYDNNKDLFNKIKEIYNKYKDEKGNIFVNYAIDKYGLEDPKQFNYRVHGLKASTKKENSPIIVRLRYYSKVNAPYMLNKKNIKKHDNTYIGLDSLGQYCTFVYEDLDNHKFVFLPIYSIFVDLKTKKIKTNSEYYKMIYKKYIGDKKVKFISSLYNGNSIEIIKKNGDVVKGQYQCFHKTNNKICLKNGSYFTISDIGFSIIDIDIIGKETKRLTYLLK